MSTADPVPPAAEPPAVTAPAPAEAVAPAAPEAPAPVPPTEPTSPETLEQVSERLTFFFGNANLRSDRFLQKHLDRGDDFGGSIDARVLLKFNSIAQYTTSTAVIIEAAKAHLGDFLVVEDGEMLKRKVPMTKKQLDDNIPLSLILKNVPVSEQEEGSKPKYTVSALDIKTLFEEYGKVALVKLKWKPAPREMQPPGDTRNRKKLMIPSGECVVEYESTEDADKAATALVGETKSLALPNCEPFEVQKLADWIAARKAATPKKEGESNKRKETPKSAPPPPDFTFDWKPGCVISLKGLDKDKCDREAIREAISNASKDIYIDYSRGQDHGAIRFSAPSEEVSGLAKKLADGDVKIASQKVGSATLLEGDAEKEYWQNFVEFKNKQMRQRAEERSSKRRKY